MPSVSPDPAELNETTSGSLPVVGVPEAAAVGKRFSTWWTVTVAVEEAPSLSVTVSVTILSPAVAYAWVGLASVLRALPSPKSHT